MVGHVIENRNDFFVDYGMYVKLRYLADKIEGPANTERKIEGIINDMLSRRLKREANLKGFEYWVNQKAIDEAESNKKRQERIKRMAEERVIEAEARKRILEREKEKIRKERGL